MKLKFSIKQKDNSISHESVFGSMAEGDSWVAKNAMAFGRPDLSLKESELAKWGLLPEQAASTETGQDGEPIYHFPKEWSVEILDITAQDEHEKKIMSRAEIRFECVKLVDEIASLDQDTGASDETMDVIFTTPAFRGICLALLCGAPNAARRLMQAHGPSLYPQAIVDAFVAKLQALE